MGGTAEFRSPYHGAEARLCWHSRTQSRRQWPPTRHACIRTMVSVHLTQPSRFNRKHGSPTHGPSETGLSPCAGTNLRGLSAKYRSMRRGMVVILVARRVCLLPLAVICRGPRLPLLQAHNRVEGTSYSPKQMAMSSLASEALEEAEQMTGDVGENRRDICMERSTWVLWQAVGGSWKLRGRLAA